MTVGQEHGLGEDLAVLGHVDADSDDGLGDVDDLVNAMRDAVHLDEPLVALAHQLGELAVGQTLAEYPLLNLLSLVLYPCPDDILVAGLAQQVNVPAVHQPRVGDHHEVVFTKAVTLLEVVYHRYQGVALVLLAVEHAVRQRVAALADQQAQHHLRLSRLPVFGEPWRAKIVLRGGLEV